MSTAVLIHGAWHGGWCWDKVRPLLQADAWTVETPSLTGLGDKAHLASPQISLQTHVQDVVTLLETKDMSDVVLCGHSSAGMVITGVADAIPDRIHTLVYLDAIIPTDGESMCDVIGPVMAGALRQHATDRGDGWLVPPEDYVSPADFGITDPTDATWVQQRLLGHPLAAYTDPLPVTTGVGRVPHKIVVRCTNHENRPHLDRGVELFGSRPGWTVQHWPSVHDVMITEPHRLRELFASILAI